MVQRHYRNLGRAFAQVLRARRMEAGLSQEALAGMCGLHRTYISLIERNVNVPSLTTIGLLAEALDVAPHELLESAEARLR